MLRHLQTPELRSGGSAQDLRDCRICDFQMALLDLLWDRHCLQSCGSICSLYNLPQLRPMALLC
jgi:hypothetical protein